MPPAPQHAAHAGVMGDGLSLGLSFPEAGCDDHAKLLLDLSKWLEDNPEFHGSLGCGRPIAKINSRSMLTDQTHTQLPIPCPIHILPCPCSPTLQQRLGRGMGCCWGRGYRCVGLFQLCCKQSEALCLERQTCSRCPTVAGGPPPHPPLPSRDEVRGEGFSPKSQDLVCFSLSGIFT